eukprot:5980339-Pyramimonas_sp.AAC.1
MTGPVRVAVFSGVNENGDADDDTPSGGATPSGGGPIPIPTDGGAESLSGHGRWVATSDESTGGSGAHATGIPGATTLGQFPLVEVENYGALGVVLALLDADHQPLCEWDLAAARLTLSGAQSPEADSVNLTAAKLSPPPPAYGSLASSIRFDGRDLTRTAIFHSGRGPHGHLSKTKVESAGGKRSYKGFDVRVEPYTASAPGLARRGTAPAGTGLPSARNLT